MPGTPATHTRGIAGAFSDLADALAEAFRPLQELLLGGVPIVEDERIPPGSPVKAEGKLFVHPIDALIIGGGYRAGVHGQLDASLDWQLRKIDQAAAAAIARLDR